LSEVVQHDYFGPTTNNPFYSFATAKRLGCPSPMQCSGRSTQATRIKNAIL